MRSTTFYVGLVLLACLSSLGFHGSMTGLSSEAYAQTPSSLPRVQSSHLVYQGAFRVPQGSSDQTSFNYGGTALGYNRTNNSLFMVGHDWYQRSAEIRIPTVLHSTSISGLNRATLLQNFADATDGKAGQVGSGPKIGGHLVSGGKLYTTAYVYYDGSGSQTRSHFTSGTNLATSNDAQGPYQVGNWAGIVSGYMAEIPPEWQSLFGGSALTGNCCLSIISRTSLGPAAAVFNPSDVGVRNPVPATPVVYYDLSHPTLGQCGDSNAQYFNCTTQIRGLVFPRGTRSVLFFGRHGTGPMCYKDEGPVSCRGTGGYNAPPYKYQVWAYDANDLLAVKNGQRSPWSITPTIWNFSLPFESASDGHDIGGAAYDPATQRIYISQMCKDSECNPLIHVFRVNVGTSAPPDTMPPSPPTAVRVQ